MTANKNADDYANARIGIFFPGFPAPLTGQCVSLAKWFLGEMCDITDWQNGRGNAKDFGDTLVNQGLAYVVSSPQRGDLVAWKKDGGGYGHIGVMCSGGNVFECNAGLVGTPSIKVPDGEGGYTTVYASRVDPLYANWRKGSPTFYRVRTYVENITQPAPQTNQGEQDMPIPDADNYYWRYNKAMVNIRGREMSRDEFNKNFVGRSDLDMLGAMLDDAEADNNVNNAKVGKQAITENWQKQIADTKKQLADETAKSIGLIDNLAYQNAKMGDLNEQIKVLKAELDKPVIPAVDEKAVVEGFFKRLWDKLFSK